MGHYDEICERYEDMSQREIDEKKRNNEASSKYHKARKNLAYALLDLYLTKHDIPHDVHNLYDSHARKLEDEIEKVKKKHKKLKIKIIKNS